MEASKSWPCARKTGKRRRRKMSFINVQITQILADYADGAVNSMYWLFVFFIDRNVLRTRGSFSLSFLLIEMSFGQVAKVQEGSEGINVCINLRDLCFYIFPFRGFLSIEKRSHMKRGFPLGNFVLFIRYSLTEMSYGKITKVRNLTWNYIPNS